VAGRRDNGQGSAYFDAARGKWRGQIMVSHKPDGTKDIRKVTADSKAAALKTLAEIRKRHDAGELGTVEQERRTLGEFVARWLEAKRATVRPTTLDRYGDLLRLHIVPVLGRTALKELKPDQVQRLYAQKLAAGLSPRTVHHLHRCLFSALADAVKWGRPPATSWPWSIRRPCPTANCSRPPVKRSGVSSPPRPTRAPQAGVTGSRPCGRWRP
jgi:hypothetical protein